MAETSSQDAARRRRGKVAALAIFYTLVVGFTLAAAAQITVQVYFAGGAAWPGDCGGGLRALARATEEARGASEGAELEPEAALRQFRGKLGAAWASRDSIERVCRATGDKTLISAFDTLEQLRYAEENAIRRNGRDLTPLRRQVQALLAGPLSDGGR